ncbi:hypothetical protein IMCC20628_03586 [Hoeflea sp. IMCC20628]|uniref:hypothetical protein n=1 Tax=Hoeflea sp. IMCC20628 TaxID=1620421 RepID=UPI00063AB082|nr:hypothetical protein [Hoeflea sp. IMCC20628]AKI02272.1 hypothetical protein IMCC20628_03586 [Hoeflea sp. IMCC20628]
MSDVPQIIRSSIESLLELGVNFRLHRHLFDRHGAEFRNLLAELHINYPVHSLGIIATPTNIEKYHFLHDQEMVAPEQIVHMVGDPIYDAAMAAYAFTIVEMCGDEVAARVKPKATKQRAWHTGIRQKEELPLGEAISQRAKFAKPFDGDVNLVNATSVIRLARMKAARNEFAHQGNPTLGFGQFLEDALAVLSQIYFLCLPEETHLKIYPWEVLIDKWEDGNFEHTEEPD